MLNASVQNSLHFQGDGHDQAVCSDARLGQRHRDIHAVGLTFAPSRQHVSRFEPDDGSVGWRRNILPHRRSE